MHIMNFRKTKLYYLLKNSRYLFTQIIRLRLMMIDNANNKSLVIYTFFLKLKNIMVFRTRLGSFLDPGPVQVPENNSHFPLVRVEKKNIVSDKSPPVYPNDHL